MATSITITKDQKRGAYSDVIEFLDELQTTYGSATNAAAVILRKSAEYTDWKDRTDSRRPKRKAV